MYYVRATGDNRYGQGTDKWLKIRSIKKCNNDAYEIGVVIDGEDRFTIVSTNYRIDHLEFAKGWPGLMPIGFYNVLENWKDVK